MSKKCVFGFTVCCVFAGDLFLISTLIIHTVPWLLRWEDSSVEERLVFEEEA